MQTMDSSITKNFAKNSAGISQESLFAFDHIADAIGMKYLFITSGGQLFSNKKLLMVCDFEIPVSIAIDNNFE